MRKAIDLAVSFSALFALLYFGGWPAAIIGGVWSVWAYFDGIFKWSRGGANG